MTTFDVMRCYVALCGVMWPLWRYVALCPVIGRYVALCVVMWRYVTLCGVMWCYVVTLGAMVVLSS